MKSTKTDRRSQRTRRILRDAFVSLLVEKRYEDITVQDVLDRANIGRSTFYEHYWDKEDLLRSQIQRVIATLSQHIDASEEDRSRDFPSRAIFERVQSQYHLYQALLRGQGIEVAQHAFEQSVQQHMKMVLQKRRLKQVTEAQLDAEAAYIAGGFMALLRWWFDTEMQWSAEHIDALFQKLLRATLSVHDPQSVQGKSEKATL